MLIVNLEIRISDGELKLTYARSSGPGGQNVNKVNSKAVLRWNCAASDCLPPAVRERFFARYGARLTSEGAIVITSDRFRDQGRNRDDCLEKLREMLLSVAQPPKRRKKTKPSRSSVAKAKSRKRQHSDKKKQRGRIDY